MGADVGGVNSPKSEPNVVPLCDVLLVLLIIFMVVTPMMKSEVSVTLPEAKNTINQPEPGQIFTVYVKKDNTVWFNTKNVPVEELEKRIMEKMEDENKADKKILLKADGDVKYGFLADVMTALRNAQIEYVGFVAEKKVATVE